MSRGDRTGWFDELYRGAAGETSSIPWADLAAKPALVLEFTDSLTPPNWQPITAPRSISGGAVLVPDASAGAQRFYRLREP